MAPSGAQMVFFDDIAATMQAMISGQVDAAGMSAFAAKSVSDRNPKAEIENKFTVRTAYYAAAVRPGDFDLLQFLRTWVFLNKHNGVLAGIYKQVHRSGAGRSARMSAHDACSGVESCTRWRCRAGLQPAATLRRAELSA